MLVVDTPDRVDTAHQASFPHPSDRPGAKDKKMSRTERQGSRCSISTLLAAFERTDLPRSGRCVTSPRSRSKAGGGARDGATGSS